MTPISLLFFWLGLLPKVPVNSYGHVENVSSSSHTFFLGKLEQAVNQYFMHNPTVMQETTLMPTLKRINDYKSEYDQKLPQSHIADQTKPQHCEEEPQNTNIPKTSMERYEQYTNLTRSGNMIKQQHSGLCTLTL